MPFTRLVDELNPPRDSKRPTLVQAELILQNAPPDPEGLPGLELHELAGEVEPQGAELDLSLEANEDENGILLRLYYHADLFDEATAAQMLAQFEAVLEAATTNPDLPVTQLSLPAVPRLPFHERSGTAESGMAGEKPAFVAARSDVEFQLAAIWRRLLRLDRVGMQESFFDLGGSSIEAVRMILRARTALAPILLSISFSRRRRLQAWPRVLQPAGRPNPTAYHSQRIRRARKCCHGRTIAASRSCSCNAADRAGPCFSSMDLAGTWPGLCHWRARLPPSGPCLGCKVTDLRLRAPG